MTYRELENEILNSMWKEAIRGRKSDILFLSNEAIAILKAEPNCIDLSRLPLLYAFGLLLIPSETTFGIGTITKDK